eukprot:353438-Chlamydomonas_euryale.AAC.19
MAWCRGAWWPPPPPPPRFSVTTPTWRPANACTASWPASAVAPPGYTRPASSAESRSTGTGSSQPFSGRCRKAAGNGWRAHWVMDELGGGRGDSRGGGCAMVGAALGQRWRSDGSDGKPFGLTLVGCGGWVDQACGVVVRKIKYGSTMVGWVKHAVRWPGGSSMLCGGRVGQACGAVLGWVKRAVLLRLRVNQGQPCIVQDVCRCIRVGHACLWIRVGHACRWIRVGHVCL